MGGLDRSRYNTRRRVEVRISRDLTLIDEHARLEAKVREEMQEARQDDSLAGPGRPPSADELAAVQARIEAECDVFVIEPVGYQRWLQLQLDHPPREKGHGWDPMTFPPAALAASCVEPELIDGDAEWLMENLDLAQWSKLWDAVLDVNMGRGDTPKSLALVLLGPQSSNGSSGTASTTPSLPDGSSEESTGGPTTTSS